MTRREDLEKGIRESYRLIHEYEAIIRTSDRPDEKARARRVIDEQWELVRGYLDEYQPLVGGVLPEDVAQLAARFSSLAELSRVERGIDAQEALRGILADEQVEATLSVLREKQASIRVQLWGGGIVVQEGGVVNVHVGPAGRDPGSALRAYREWLVGSGQYLPLRGVDLGASDPSSGQQRVSLAQVYVDLDTTTPLAIVDEEKKARGRQRAAPGERESRPLRALEATIQNRHLVLLGDPGSGKSTYVGHLALCLARHGLEPQGGWIDRLTGWPDGEADVVPIPVVLRDFARWLPARLPKADPCHLWNFIVHRLEAQNLGFAADALSEALEHGQALVLLDGLDEIPTREQRVFVRDAVACFARRYPRSRILVTCRVLSYQDPAWQLPASFPSFELAAFDEAKIDGFIGAWYVELGRLNVVRPAEADALAARFRQAVRRPDLWRLAPNPLLLTVMALVHTHKGRLPDARALLYEDTVDILLWRWEQLKADDSRDTPRLHQLLLDAGRNDMDLKRMLWRLAFEAHSQGGGAGALADIGEWQLQKALAGLHPQGSTDWARQVIELIKLRAGLLLERVPETYTFPHRTFQEYLAGAHLSAQSDFARQAASLVAEGALWREVILLAVGRLVYLGGDMDKPLALAGELCPARQEDAALAWQKAWLAGDVLLEVGLNRVRDSALGRDLAERVRERLAALVDGGQLSPVERAQAGDTLARLDDPRRGVGLISLCSPAEDSPSPGWERGPGGEGLPDIVWCEVPAGPFLMGSNRSDEKPQHEVDLPAFLIARCPVTNAQYAAFVEDGGYGQRGYWAEAERDGMWREGRVKGRYDDESRAAPVAYGGAFDLPNHPVVGVCWYEALAFCRWLENKLNVKSCKLNVWRHGQLVTCNLQLATIRLPTEAEWEKAARGGDGRIYPWGEKFDPDLANTFETGIGATSAVGCFPGGASPYGVLDMSGNVWEWCADWYDEKYYASSPRQNPQGPDSGERRVVRGGSWVDSQVNALCAVRSGVYPDSRSDYLGFRCVSPISLS